MAIAAANATKGRIASGVTNTVTTTSVNTSATGSTFFLFMQFEGSSTFSSISDNKGNTYTQIGTELTANSGAKSRTYYCQNGTGGSGHTFTATTATNVAITLHAIEITGGKTTAILNPTPPAANDDTASPFTSGSITTVQADALLVSCIGASNTGSNPATHAESTGFTIQSGADETDASQYWSGAIATKVLTATGTYSSSFTETGATTAAVWIAAFEAAAGGGGGSPGPIEGFVERDIARVPGRYEPEFRLKSWRAGNFTKLPNAPIDVSISETGSAAETQSNAGVFGASAPESGTATDTASSSTTLSASRSEAGAAAETSSCAVAMASAVAESVAASESQSNAALFASAATESAAASDARSSSAVMGASVSEAASAVETASVGGLNVVESTSATESQTSAGVFASSAAEIASAAETQSSSQTMGSAIAESVSATDTSSSTLGGGSNVSASEAATAISIESGALVIASTGAESSSATANQSAAFVMALSVAESVSATDNVGSSQTSFAALLESANAIEISTGLLVGETLVSVTESANAVSTCSAEIALFAGKPHARIGRAVLRWPQQRIGS